jgi:predicted membrane-bound spermidine synthase
MVRLTIGVIAFIVILAVFGKEDYQVALMEEQMYCERVIENIHTNYKEINCENYN